MKVTLKIFQDQIEVLNKVLEEGTYTIGRSGDADIQLKDENVSRSHAEIRVTDTTVYFTNTSQSEGIFKDGQLLETGELEHGCEMSIGPYKVLVFHGTQEQAQEKTQLSDPLFQADAAAVPGLEPDAPAEPQGEIALEPQLEEPQLDDPGAGFDSPLEDPAPDNVSQFPEPEPAPAAASNASQPMVEGTAALAVGATQVQMKPLVAKLLFDSGPLKGEEIFIETYEVTFGRSKRADIFIDDPKLSRIHAKISRMGSGYRLIDMSSRNGTYVNGMRVLEHPLNSFDVIGLGKTKIKFLIHDMVLNEMAQKGNTVISGADPTKSVQLTPSQQIEIEQARQQAPPPFIPPNHEPGAPMFEAEPHKKESPINLRRMLMLSIIIGGLAYLLLSEPVEETKPEEPAPTAKIVPTTPIAPAADIPPAMPKEYIAMTPAEQRAIEGHYTTAQRMLEREDYDQARFHLNKIHEALPFYKQSREMFDTVQKRLKEKQFEEAQAKAKQNDSQDLLHLLEDGVQYLKVGDFDRAGETFEQVLSIDPENDIAKNGLRAAELKLKDLNAVPPEKDPELEKRKQVIDLFQKAVGEFANKSYQKAIETAQQIRAIKLEGDDQYLLEAKQIIDRARMLQKEEFEPFLLQAKEKFVEGDFNTSRDLCEEMLKRDASYEPAKRLLKKNIIKLNRLAKEAYTTGYVLESMGKIDEAIQYWRRSENYVRPGDEYFKKVKKKLEQYQ